MKTNYQHPALKYHCPETGRYDEYEYINSEGIIKVHGEYEVCPYCGGHGHHFRNDLDENALVQSMCEDGNEEGMESYHSGSFDEICQRCNGLRVVIKPNLPHWANVLIGEWENDEREYRATVAAERRVGA